jgi:hypothetical protein
VIVDEISQQLPANRAAGNAGALLLYRKVLKETPSRKLLFPGPKAEASNEQMDEWIGQFNNLLKDGGAKGVPEDTADQTSRIWLYGDSKTSPGLPGMVPSIRLEPGGSIVR